MKLALLLTFGLLFLQCLADGVTIDTFLGPPFSVKPPSGMYELTGLSIPSGNQIFCYGDFNNDKFTDFVAVSDDLKTLTVFLYSHEDHSFSSRATITVKSDTITAVMSGDYNYDGKLDIMIVSLTADKTKTDLNIYLQTETGAFATTPLSDSINSDVQPFLLDIDGDRNLEFIYVEDGARKIKWISTTASPPTPFKEELFSKYASTETNAGCKDPSTVLGNTFAKPHSNSFLDFNGDCAADLFITSLDANNKLVFEIWLRKDESFCLVDATTIDSAISLASFGDMNNDGRLDLVFADVPAENTPASMPMNLHVLYNQFSANYKEPCMLQNKAMISPFDSASYNSAVSIAGKSQVTPITSGTISAPKLIKAEATHVHPRIRIGDINIDGFPDLLFVVSDKIDAAYGNILLGINDAGTIKFDSSSLDTTDDKAYYSIYLENSLISPKKQTLDSYKVLTASFFDFDEIGHLGIWAVEYDTTTSKSKPVGLFNFVNTENFILKTLGLNGNFKAGDDDITRSLGGIYYGPSVECVLTDINGSPRLAKSTQLPQSAYVPLDLPYMFMGLGRTNNYIENFIMGIPKANGKNDVQTSTWTPIIPNSQLIVNPRLGEAWTLDVYVNPTSETLYVVLTTLAILLILGAIIIHLHRKEKEEDEKNRDVLLHIFG